MSFRNTHANQPNTQSPAYRGGYSPASFRARSESQLVQLINAKITYYNSLVSGPFAALPGEQAKIVRARRQIAELKEEYIRLPRKFGVR